MALVKAQLQADILAIFNELKTREDNQQDCINYLALHLATAVDNYVRSGSIYATPTDVLNATMTAGANPVVAANNLISKIE